MTISPLNERSLLVSFGNSIDVDVNRKVIALHQQLQRQSFDGFIESVPAYSSIAIFYHPPAQFEAIEIFLKRLLLSEESLVSDESVINVPVLYDGDDLALLAQQHQLDKDEVISIHTSKEYRVFMLGFLPGFAYMGSVDERIATPRKSSPRTTVPAGSVGIAGIQTGIYPQASPGGWQLIGRTPIKIFDVKRESPCLLKPGDMVRFYSINATEFNKLNEY
jgi:KipI family sensor histidine kinase inhibitor